MRRQAGVSVLVVGATIALAAGGGLAWAGWSVGGGAAALTVESARIPVMSRPRAEFSGASTKIAWTRIRLSSGRPVGGYVVIRQDGADRAVACTTAASDTRCRDRAARPGSIVTYVVHAIAGTNWAGEDSHPSDPVPIPARAKVVGGDHKNGPDETPATTATSLVLRPEENSPTAGPTPTATADPVPSESVSPPAAGEGVHGETP